MDKIVFQKVESERGENSPFQSEHFHLQNGILFNIALYFQGFLAFVFY